MFLDRLRVGVVCLFLLPVAACGGASSHRSPAASASSDPSPSPPLAADRLTGALLPPAGYHGYHRFGPSSGTDDALIGTRLAAAVGLPNPSGACATAAGSLEFDAAKAGPEALSRPYAEVTYTRGPGPAADLVFETLTTLPGGASPGATGITVPAGCARYTTRDRGIRIAVTVRPATRLPRVPGAVVTGMRSTMDFGARGRTEIDTVNVRSGSLLMLVAVGGRGDQTGKTARTVAAASARARGRLG